MLLRWMSSFGSASFTIGSRTLTLGPSLGSGGFAYVNQATDDATGEQFAVKRMICQTPEQLKAAHDEQHVHERIGSHPCLMPSLGHAQVASASAAGAQDVLLLLPLARGGALSELIRK
jgi:serine/threonine protein kinase